MKMLTDEMLERYHGKEISELYQAIQSGYRLDGTETTITSWRLSERRISDVGPIAQVLPHTKITTLWLEGNSIEDVSALAQVLPQTQVTKLSLWGNSIEDVAALAKVLPQTQITSLDLNLNAITDTGNDLLRGIKKNKNGEDIKIFI